MLNVFGCFVEILVMSHEQGNDHTSIVYSGPYNYGQIEKNDVATMLEDSIFFADTLQSRDVVDIRKSHLQLLVSLSVQ